MTDVASRRLPDRRAGDPAEIRVREAAERLLAEHPPGDTSPSNTWRCFFLVLLLR